MKSLLLSSCILLILGSVSASAQATSAFSFSPLDLHEVATIALAVDVPNNLDPTRVWYKKDPGHVFVILERIDTVAQRKQALVWGFYPTHPVSSIFFRRVKSELRNNAGREYNAVIRKKLSTEELLAGASNVLTACSKCLPPEPLQLLRLCPKRVQQGSKQ